MLIKHLSNRLTIRPTIGHRKTRHVSPRSQLRKSQQVAARTGDSWNGMGTSYYGDIIIGDKLSYGSYSGAI